MPKPEMGRFDMDLSSARIPESVRALFDGEDLEARFGLGYELVTVDEDGWPRVAMLSHGEILVFDDQQLRLALWPGTHTGINLASGRPALLSVVAPGFVCYLSGRARSLASSGTLDFYEMTVERVRTDVHEGLPVTGPITFRNEDSQAGDVVADWRLQIEALRRLPRPTD